MRLEDELGLALDGETEALLRRSTALVTRAAGERILVELPALSAGYRRLAEVGLLAELGGAVDERLEALDDPDFRLVAVLRERLADLPISNDLAGTRTCSARATARGRVPALDPPFPPRHRALGARRPRVRRRRRAHRRRGGRSPRGPRRAARPRRRARLQPGPEIGRILAVIDEERAAGTIATREEALELARTLSSAEAAR